MKKIKKVWNYPLDLRPWHFKDNLRAIKLNTKSFFMRTRYGVSRTDCWDLDEYMINVLRNGLVLFKEDYIGYPGIGEANTTDRWDAILNRMIDLCEIISIEPFDDPKVNEIFDKHFDDKDESWKDEWKSEIELAADRKLKAKKELAELLVKWSDHLWW